MSEGASYKEIGQEHEGFNAMRAKRKAKAKGRALIKAKKK